MRGSVNILGSRFVGGTNRNRNRMCDIFVHHVAKQSTLIDLKFYLNHNGFDTGRLRIDITSNTAATYKSFRIVWYSMVSFYLIIDNIYELYLRSERVISDFRVCDSSILDSLHRTYCMHMYGSGLWDLNCKTLKWHGGRLSGVFRSFLIEFTMPLYLI